MADSRMSECITELNRELDILKFSEMEIRLSGVPSSYMAYVSDGVTKDAHKIIEKYFGDGLENEIAFWQDLESRVSSKWLYWSGLYAFMSEDAENYFANL